MPRQTAKTGDPKTRARPKRTAKDSLVSAATTRRRLETELGKVAQRNEALCEALAVSRATARAIAEATYVEETRRNASGKEREKVVCDLRSTQATLLARIDEDKEELAMSTARMRDLSMALILAHEEEQRRIGAELHDEMGQELTALRILLGRAKSAREVERRNLVAEAEELVGRVMETVRGICRSLRPQALDDLGLIKGLEWHLRTISSRTELKIEFEAQEVDEGRLSPIMANTIFRVTQEAVTNVLRHAKATRARVALSMSVEALEFSVRDDGCGFERSRLAGHASTGLSSMMERVSLVGGECRIDSKRRKGTCVTVRIPLRGSA